MVSGGPLVVSFEPGLDFSYYSSGVYRSTQGEAFKDVNGKYKLVLSVVLVTSLVLSVLLVEITRFKCGFALLHSFRVWFCSTSLVLNVVMLYFTRFECS